MLQSAAITDNPTNNLNRLKIEGQSKYVSHQKELPATNLCEAGDAR